MLIQFTVENFKSFKEKVTFSMVATSLRDNPENTFHLEKNIELLKTAVIFGANASGKSNLFTAIGFMKNFVINSSKETQIREEIGVDSFKLSTMTENKPSYFEIIFSIDSQKYRYGFEVDRKIIHSEWLFYTPTTKEALLFSRKGQTVELGQYFKEGKGLEVRARENALFLSVVAQLNGSISGSIITWFNNLNLVSGNETNLIANYTMERLESDKSFRRTLVEFMKIADLSIEDISVEKDKIWNTSYFNLMNDAQKQFALTMGNGDLTRVPTYHTKYDENNRPLEQVKFELGMNESMGTRSYFYLMGPIIDTLSSGKILLVDELDANLHPQLSKFLISLFNSPRRNKKNAQLIFNTNNSYFLGEKGLLRRDQIWFTEKDRYGSSTLLSLADYKIRKDRSFEKDYIAGRYGAVPYIDERKAEKILSRAENE